MRLEEAPEDVDLVFRFSHDVTLSKVVWGGDGRVLMDRHKDRVAQGQSGQICDVSGLGC